MNIKNELKQWLVEKENKRYAELLQKRRITYGEWINKREDAGADLVLSDERTVSAWCLADPEFVVLVSSEGAFLSRFGKKCRCYFEIRPEVQLIYGDEEVGDSERKCPWFKPDWSPDVFREYFYLGSAVAIRRSLLEKMADMGMPVESFSEEKEYNTFLKKHFPDMCQIPLYRVTDETAYRKWMYACVEYVGGFKNGCDVIGHIPEMSFICEGEAEQLKFREEWKMEDVAKEVCGMVSVIIPSKDNPKLLEKCIRACRDVTALSQIKMEIIVVDNGSSPDNRKNIEAFLAGMREDEADGRCGFAYLYDPMDFNFSKMCNLGAKKATGQYLLFLNDDVELCKPGTIEDMAALAGQEYTGAVGLKLLYPGTDKIQHAGIANLPMGPVHKMQFLKDSECYYFGANRGNRNVLAVTAACLMVEKKKFEEVGGFSEELKVAFNDVDLCFALYEQGYHNVCVNDKFAYHHESLSRGADESVDKLNRLLAEREKLYARHPRLDGVDPYYSQHLNRDGLDTRIRPGYVTSLNQTQQTEGALSGINLVKYREDACLMVRVEDFRDRHAVGYGVVLGDNNACYEKELVFEKVGETMVYTLPLAGQYRPDLEENMPDQTNVALCGFDVALREGAVPYGTYRIGMAARNRVTGLKLVNWTNRYVQL